MSSTPTATPTDDVPTGWVAPTSFGQERLWLASKLDPGSTAYNLAAPVHLPQELTPDQLHEVLATVVQRHEVLRTSLHDVDGRVEQRVHDAVPIRIAGLDREPVAFDEADPRSAPDFQFAARADVPLDRAPLWRASGRRAASGGWLLFLTLHHTIFDGASHPLLLAELKACSRALAAGTEPVLPELDIQYGDYAHWQRDLLQGARLEAELDHWRGQLLGAPPVHAVPASRPRPAVADLSGDDVVVDLPAALQRGIGEVAAELRATTSMVQLASWAALLARMSGERDVVVGVPFSGRPTRQTEPLIGMFVNTLPIRVPMSPDPTMRELVTTVRTAVLDATEHQLVPFQRLVEELAPPRDGSVHPLYQLGFNQLPLAHLNRSLGSAQDELCLEIAGGTARIEYRTDLFDAEDVAALADRWLRLAEGLVADLDRPLSAVAWLSDDETDRVLRRWNDTADPGVGLAGGSVVDRLLATCAAAPDAVAVADSRGHLDRAGLEARTAALATRLRARGVGPESVVGICLPRSVDLVVAVLGVLRAGAAYCPLDPDYPAERLAFMAADAGLVAVLTDDAASLPFDPPDGVEVLVAAELAEPGDPADEVDLRVPVAGDQAAYVLYTSGSTGRPKGAVNTHAAIANRLDWMQRAYPLGADDVVLQKTPTSFDVSGWELLWAPMVGARLVMAEPGGHQDPIYLRRAIVAHGVTTIHFVPSMLAAFLATPGVAECTSLRRVVCSGEELPAALVARFRALLPGCELHNLYGPTEAAIDVTAWACTEAEADAGARVPIGRPITNLRCLVLDESLAPVPPGVVGDLYLAGVGLARGYHRRPGLTADRFVPDPYGAPGARMYRTGDLARWRRDGALEFLGRLDAQVKLRGQRIELGELESVLGEHPGVHAAAARVIEPHPGDQRLVAHVVAAEDVDPAALRAWVAERLPDALVPQSVSRLDSLPVGPSGKLDRGALPDPTPVTAAATGSAEPTTEVQRQVAAVVAEVLGLDRVGVDDDFFVLGGHSLLAARVTARVAADLGVELGIHEFFARPTVAGLAWLVEQRLGQGARPDLRVPRARGEQGGRVLSFAQERVWFMEQYAPGTAAYCVPVAIRLTGALDHGVLQRAVGVVCTRQDSLRMRFPADDSGQPTVVVDPATDVVEVPTVTVADEDAAWAHARAVAAEPFDVAAGPLVRWTLLAWPTDPDSELLLVVVAHHLVTDGWSSDLLVAELLAAHAALLVGAEPQLPELPVGYGDFAAWQRERLAGPTLDALVTHWSERLHDVPALDLPTDRPRPARQQFAGATVEVRLDEPARVALERLGAEQGATLHMVLRTAWAWLLAGWSGQNRFAVATPVAGRVSPDVEGLVGMFVNTLAIPAHVDPAQTFRDAVRETRGTVLDALAHQELPFEVLVGALGVERDVGRSPVAQTLFALQNFALRDHGAHGAQSAVSGLSAWWQPVDTGGTRFDLECQVVEVAGGLRTTLTYSTALLDESTVISLAEQWTTMLATLAALPDTRPGELHIPVAARVAAASPAAPALGVDDEPAGDAEDLVAAIWTDVLGLAEVGAHDDFFALGGHSLLATQVAVRVTALLDVEAPVALLFEAPTLRGYARAVEALLLDELELLTDEEAHALLADADDVEEIDAR